MLPGRRIFAPFAISLPSLTPPIGIGGSGPSRRKTHLPASTLFLLRRSGRAVSIHPDPLDWDVWYFLIGGFPKAEHFPFPRIVNRFASKKISSTMRRFPFGLSSRAHTSKARLIPLNPASLSLGVVPFASFSFPFDSCGNPGTGWGVSFNPGGTPPRVNPVRLNPGGAPPMANPSSRRPFGLVCFYRPFLWSSAPLRIFSFLPNISLLFL